MFKPLTLLSVSALAITSFNAAANCDPGETVIKFSHVTNTDKHPKGLLLHYICDRWCGEDVDDECGESGITMGGGDVPLPDYRHLRALGIDLVANDIDGARNHH